MKLRRFFLPAAFALILPVAAFGDAVSELAVFSSFKEVDLNRLLGGEVMTARGPAMKLSRGLSVQFCYVVPEPLQKALEFHETWNASRHAELKAYEHGSLPSKPGPGDFSKMTSVPGNGPVRALVAATRKLDPNQPQLLMSRAEAKQFKPEPSSQGGAIPPDVSAFWSNLLARRAADFLSGGLSKVPPYDYGAESISLTQEAARLLKEEPKIRAQLGSLGDVIAGGGVPPSPKPYWELSDVEGVAAFSLGAFSAKRAGEGWQAVDLHYYSSGGYFVLLTFYQMWPVKIGDRQATLVWRCDMLSAPSLGELHGVERIASVGVMAKEIQKTINIFLKDAGKN